MDERIRLISDKLFNDLNFAAPEMWREHIQRRMRELAEVLQKSASESKISYNYPRHKSNS